MSTLSKVKIVVAITLLVWGSAFAEPVLNAALLSSPFCETCDSSAIEKPGPAPYGSSRRGDFLGGLADGPQINWRILPSGADTQLVRGDGILLIGTRYYIEPDDVKIRVHNTDRLTPMLPRSRPNPAGASPVLEAPPGRYDLLNENPFISSVTPKFDPKHPTVTVRVYRVDES